MRFSLRLKWTAALLVTGAVPLALFGYTTAAIQKRGLEDAERQLEVSAVDHATTLVDDALEQASEATHRVGRVLTEAAITDDDARLALAREAMARAELLASVSIYGVDELTIDTIARRDAGAVLAAPASIDLGEAAGMVWLPVEHVPAGVVMRVAEPLVRDGNRRGFVLGTVDEKALAARLLDLSRARFEGRSDGVLLLDRDLRIVVGDVAGPLARGESLRGKDLFSHHVLPVDAFATELAISTEFTSATGEAMSGSARFVHNRWVIVARRPKDVAYASLVRARAWLLGAGLSFVLAAIALGALLAARTVRPIRSLVELTRAYARRQFDQRSSVRTNDELEELGTSLGDMARDLASGEKEIARRVVVESDLSRYLPASVAKSIAEGTGTLELGGERREVTVLFADVVAFTAFAEGAEPERAVQLLNQLFAVLTEVVFRHGGTVDKFLGDCIMAIFGAPSAQDDHAARALAAAEDMHRFVEAHGPEWKEKFGVELRLGIGVNSGVALVGNLGSATRMEYTAIGDVVNVAARLEGLARPGQTLLTAEVATSAGEAFEYNALGQHPLRGKKQLVDVVELK
jgi:adenylate cyclase